MFWTSRGEKGEEECIKGSISIGTQSKDRFGIEHPSVCSIAPHPLRPILQWP